MPPVATVSKRLLDLSIKNKLGLARYETWVVQRIIALLNAGDADLEARLSKALDRTAQLDGTARLAAIRKELLSANLEAYQRLGRFVTNEMRDLVVEQAGVLAEHVEGALPFKFSVTRPSAQLLKALVTEDPLHGRLLGAQIDNLAGNRAAALMEQLQVGTLQGESWGQILTRIRGTSGGGYRDGVLETVGRRQAEAVARTAVQGFTEGARELLIQENTDLFQGIMWVATLDRRTCFRRGTLVEAYGGRKKPIENLSNGDMIRSGSGVARRVLGVTVQPASDWRRIEFANGEEITCTATHPFLGRFGWREASELRPGDQVGRLQALREDFLSSEYARSTPAPLLRHMPDSAQAESSREGDIKVQGLRQRISRYQEKGVLYAGLLSQELHLENRDCLRALRKDGASASVALHQGREEWLTGRGVLQPTVHGGCAWRKADSYADVFDLRQKLQRQGWARRHRSLFEGVPAPEARNQLSGLREEFHDLGLYRPPLLFAAMLPPIQGGDAHRSHAPQNLARGGDKFRAGGEGRTLVSRLRDRGAPCCRDGRLLLAPQAKPSAQGRGDFRGGPEASENSLRLHEPQGQGSCSGGGIPRAEGWLTVARVTIDRRPELCYDVEVEQDHSFLVGEQGIIVHNTQICQLRDGKVWDLDHRPIGHNLDWLSGPGRAHWSCRSSAIPVLKDVSDLKAAGITPERLGPQERAALDNPFPITTDYEDWLRDQPLDVQADALSSQARAQEFRDGAPLEKVWDMRFDRLPARAPAR